MGKHSQLGGTGTQGRSHWERPRLARLLYWKGSQIDPRTNGLSLWRAG